MDPAWEADRLLRTAEEKGIRIDKVLVTHTHNDHVEGVATVVKKTRATGRVM